MSDAPPLRRIQHVGLKVHDLDEAVNFYGGVMGLAVSDRYEPGDNPHNPWGICFMRCGEGHHEISLIAYPEDAGLSPKEGDMRKPEVGLHHVAFEVDSKEALEAWAARVRSRGIDIAAGPLVHSPTHPEGDGTLGENRAFYFHDPSGNGIEIFCDMARIDADANRVSEEWYRARLERDGYARDAADPPPAWRRGVSSMAGAREKFGQPPDGRADGAEERRK